MRYHAIFSILLFTLACGFPAAAVADGPLPWKESGSGDWNGQRTHLDEDIGLTFWWLQDITAQQNVSGGISRGGAAESRSMLEVNYQFEPLTPLKGSEIQVSAGWNVGTNVQDFTGSLLSSTGIWRPNNIRLYELYWGQFFADKQVHFKIGRLGLCPFEAAYTALFATGDISNGYYCNPGGLYLNQPVASWVYPIATWGFRMKIEPKNQDFQFWVGVYNGWPRDLPETRGVDFTLNLIKSTYVQGEFWYKLNQDPEDEGLPGNYKIGAVYDSAQFERFDDPAQTERGNPGWYLIFDQMLFQEKLPGTPQDPSTLKGGWKKKGPSHQGLYLTASFVHHPKTAVSLAPYWVSAGLYYKGAIPHRDADMMSFAFYHGSLNPDTTLDYEFQLRFFYSLQFTPWLFMSPHVHYFKKPGGGDTPHAVMLGMWFHFTL